MNYILSNEREKRKANIYDGEFFQILNKQKELLLVQCMICSPEIVKLRSTIKSNGNILKHIQVKKYRISLLK